MTRKHVQPVLVPFDAQGKKVRAHTRTNLHTYRVHLGVRSRPLAGYTQAELHEHDAAPPTKAEVWLQLWEVDTWQRRARRERIGRRDSDVPAASGKNERLIEIGGYVRKPKTGRRPEFVALQKPAGVQAERKERYGGWIELELAYVEGSAVTTGVVNVPIDGESELRLEVGAWLAPKQNASQVGGKDIGDVWPRALSLIHLKNMQRILQTQADDGGVALAFVVEYNSPLDKQAMRWRWNRKNKGLPRPAKYASCPSQAKLVGENEFVNAGSDWSRQYAALTLGRRGELTVGYQSMTHHTQVQGLMSKVMEAARKAQGDPNLKVKRLAFFCHGLPTYLKTRGHGQSGSLMRGKLPGFLGQIAPFLADDVIVMLFACDTGLTSTGRGSQKKEWDFGKPNPTKGAGSFALAFAEGLAKQGKKSALVWAHINAKHTTRNPYLRAFQVKGASVSVQDVVELSPQLTVKQLERAAWEKKPGRTVKIGAHYLHLCSCPLSGGTTPGDPPPGGPFELRAVLTKIKQLFP